MLSTKICLNCNSTFSTKDIRQKFCGRSCAVTHNNKESPKKKAMKSISCKKCGDIVLLKPKKDGGYYKRQYCDKCAITVRHETRGRNITPWELRTKEEVFSGSCNWQSARTAIRKHANKIFSNSSKPKCCEVCGYTKHFEVCHIKAVSAFQGGAKLSEINAITNLVALCPNHHWEFDSGILTFKELMQ